MLAGIAALSALALAFAALVVALDGLGLVYATLEGVLGPGMMGPPDEIDGGTWGWFRLAIRALEAAGLVALALGIGLGAFGSKARGVAGIAAALAGAALVLAVLGAFAAGAGAIGDRVLAPFIRTDFEYQLDVGGHVGLGLLLQAGPGLVLVMAGLALAAHAWAQPRIGLAALLASTVPLLASPGRAVGTALVFSIMQKRAWGVTQWGTVEGLVHLLQLGGDGIVAMAGVAGVVAVALLTPRPAPSDT